MQTQTPTHYILKNSFSWMMIGLVISAIISYWAVSSQWLMGILNSSPFIFWGFLIAKLALVWYLSSRIDTMSTTTAQALFIVYSILTGVFFGVILLAYTSTSVFGIFLATAAVFFILSRFGYTTDRDLSSWGRYLIAGLIGIIITSVINIFLGNSIINIITNIIGVIIFTGFTAYDVQRIKYFGTQVTSADQAKRYAILGALTLYLDFVNLFFSLISLLGDRR